MDLSTLLLPTATAFGLALLHSLWIGALVYALIRTVLPALRSAGARHNLAYGGLLAIGAGFAVAFYRNFDYAPICENLIASSASFSDIGLNFTTIIKDKTAMEAIQELIPGFAPWLSMIYLFGLLPAAAYLLRDQRRIQFLRTTGLDALPQSWSERLGDELSRHPATRKVVCYLSDQAGEVMTLGFWSPVIVFPIALVNTLTPEMARTILLHEIAHLRHYDHWLNYPQQFLRTFFFYHPAIHGLCRLIDREREHRCDDWVADRCNDRRTYATALVAVARTSITPSNTLAMSASKTPFSSRIQRLFQGEEKQNGNFGFSLLFIALLAAGHLSFTSMGADAGAVDCLGEQSAATTPAEPEMHTIVVDTDGNEINVPNLDHLKDAGIDISTLRYEAAPNDSPNDSPAEELKIEVTAPGKVSLSGNIDQASEADILRARKMIVANALPFFPRINKVCTMAADTTPPAKKQVTKVRLNPDGSVQNNPLFIVDGVQRDMSLENIEIDLDPSDIKSISVFKNQEAIDLYGQDGANGVIVITTKGGEEIIVPGKKTSNPDHSLNGEKIAPGTLTEFNDLTFSGGDDYGYIVDGKKIKRKNVEKISVDNIKSVDVFKGKDKALAFGFKNKAGVVKIVTKE